MRREPGLSAGDRAARGDHAVASTSRCWSSSCRSSAGATVVLAGRETATDGPRLARLIEAGGATVMQATPATWRLLLATAAGEGVAGAHGALAAARRCRADARRASCCRSVAALWNLYGPTETTVVVHRRARATPDAGTRCLIGRPIANTRLYVLDPRGCAGAGRRARASCAIGGAGLARGYLAPAGADRRALRARPVRAGGGPARASTAPATSPAGARTAASSSWAVSTTR